MNNIEVLQHKEVSLLELMHKFPGASQRFLSSRLQISLGQVNSIIKVLMDKGELELAGKGGSKVKYTLTSRGYARWLRYVKSKLSEAFQQVTHVKREVGSILDQLFKQGVREFVLEGDNDSLAEIVGEAFCESIGDKGKLLWGPSEIEENRVVLKLNSIDSTSKEGVVNLLQEVAKAD